MANDKEREAFETAIAIYREAKPYWSKAREEICWDIWRLARDAALEEAAKIADDKAARVNSTWIANDIAEGIRALKGNSHE